MRRLSWILSSATLALVTSNGSSSAQTTHACDLLSSAELAALTGRSELAQARQIRGSEDQSEPGGAYGPGGTACAFMGTSISLEMQPLASLERFEAAIPRRVQAGELQPHQGLGDAAWFRFNRSLDQHGFVVRAGNSLLILMMDTSEAGSADAAKAALLPVAEAAIKKLR